MPANVALDRVYMTEWLRRMHVVGMPGPSTLEELDAQIFGNAGQEASTTRAPAHQTLSPELKARVRQSCLATTQMSGWTACSSLAAADLAIWCPHMPSSSLAQADKSW